MFRRSIQVSITALVAFGTLLAACAPMAASTATQAQPTATMVEATATLPQPTETQAQPAPTQPEPTADPYDPASLTGDIYTAGSSTVGPLTEAIIEEFVADGFKGQVKNDIIGSGAGFERFCKSGETDISNASRPIKDSEVENCQKLNPPRNPIGFHVGIDALTVVVNPQNDFVTNITMEELTKLFTTAEKWSDVNPAWPAEPILRYTPGTDSGTFDFFVETVIQKPLKLESLEDAKKLALDAKNLNLSEDDNVLVQGVEGNKYAIGYFGFAYYKGEGSNLKALSINGVKPDEKTAEDGSYPLSRPLFIYSDAGIMKAKPQVAAFIRYYLENVNSVISKVGYFPVSQETADKNMQLWEEAMKP
ncbi:phosphate binding protein [Anaerolinea thermolimosa]|uniref:Phosphate-binding protein n=1 Tax=Anaerolinea thermolimosa TaxID=229919 RepID=A0A7U9KMI0_9CHLR|nr:PstS family phosphate ABC transporter substrate-binding protein [Anaerolinea thermolimosa]GAP08589.1 phosphate binding protein [Anaerolinea thermolimosa]